MINLPISTLDAIFATTTFVIFILYLREYFLRKKSSEQERRISQITREKSIRLLEAAEQAETQVISQGSYAAKKLVEEFESQLKNIVSTSQGSIISSQDRLIKFMEDLQKRSEQFEEASRKTGEERINQLFERLEGRLSDFLITTEQNTTSSIELELKASRQLIETYKNQQLKLIDENIVAMMEQTLAIVLAKKLSLKDQLDLVYEALEKAKVERFVV